MKYNNKSLILQTPKLYTKYGINTQYNNLDVSFQNINNAIDDIFRFYKERKLKDNISFYNVKFMKKKNLEN